MIKVKRFSVLVGLLCLTVGGCLWWSEDIVFYGRLYHTYRIGQQFYADYPGLTADIQFHPTMLPQLDVYWPERQKNLPVLVFIHGGLEKYATKELFAALAKTFVAKEMVVVIPDYTLYPPANYHQMTGEVAAAITWTLDNIEQYGGNPDQTVVVGHSSGAYLGMLAVLDEQFFEPYNHPVTELCGLISVAGTYDIPAQYAFEQQNNGNPEMFAQLMGGVENFAVASPQSYVRADLPPLLLIHGDQDKTVPLHIATSFQQTLQAAGVENRLNIYKGKGHTDYLFEAVWDGEAAIVGDFVEFVEACKDRG